MSIIPGTLVKLPNGRDGVVVTPPFWSRDRVLVKVKGGRKWWFRIDECTPVFSVS
jgi:hypothetical protein